MPAESVPDTMKDAEAQGPIDVRETIVEIQVSDLTKSREWYSRLFGKNQTWNPFRETSSSRWAAAGCRL
jgi:hypothetical protein